ncbi:MULTISPECIES: hypothetical protein [Hafnia]|uniref:hypothetical protein n=1 Tax=Hafnia TaxID=568 RepID=UPI000E06DB10|nr:MULTISPECIES: hypothetical protein [Hafnia]STQ68424.1 Uncharacterised protein [Hafnia alvei]
MSKQEVVINSEDEAFAFIEQYVSGYSLPENVSFGEWPNLKFKLTGKKFNKSLTPSVMKGFIEMQAQINKSYALVKYGVPDPRKLSKEEKEAGNDSNLLIVFYVQIMPDDFVMQLHRF